MADDTIVPPGCICDPMDFAALGHMTTCPRYERTTSAELRGLVRKLDTIPDVRTKK